MLSTRIRNPQNTPKYFACINVDSQKHLVMPYETITVSSLTRHAFSVFVPLQRRESRRCFQAWPETARLYGVVLFYALRWSTSNHPLTALRRKGKMRLKRLTQLTKGFLLLPRGWCSRSESRLHCLLNKLATIHRLVPFLSLTHIVSVSFWSNTSWVSWGDTRCAAFTDLRVTISCSLVGISLTRPIPPIGTGSSCSQDCYGGHLRVSQLVLPRDQAQQPNGFDLCALQTTVLLAVIFRHKHE